MCEQELSKRLFRTLDCLGLSREMVLFRREQYKIRNIQLSRLFENSLLVGKTVGSKAEGITKPFESDEDILFYLGSFICIEKDYFVLNSTNQPTRFGLQHLSPGYCVLTNDDNGTEDESLRKFVTNGLLSSTFLKSVIIDRCTFPNEIHGPAVSSNSSGQPIDNVFTFCSFCPSILYSWMSRPRRNDWPPKDVRERILFCQEMLFRLGLRKTHT